MHQRCLERGRSQPAEKYAKAFGLDVKDFMDKSKRRQCQTDEGCESLNNASKCAIRAGKTSGYCIPTWFGICHAWAPAAILEASRPARDAQRRDGLISDVYDGAGVATVFTGARYNGGDDAADEYGRHTNAAYRDLNPAYFHIASANILGKLNAHLLLTSVEPARAGFKVFEQTAMSLEEAAQTFYGLEEYPACVREVSSFMDLETYTDGGLVASGEINRYTTGKYYYYLLELDDAGEIIGGEWVYDSDSDHPDFLWVPKAKPAANTVTSIGLSYADVSMLLEKSVACSDSTSAAGSVSSGSVGESTEAPTEVPTTSTSAPTSGSGAL
ncbi:Transglutaminase elicitor [Phytophthora cactorum]|nr:Transglutaminase elicitor [Phytophthora cactorum]